MKKLSLQKFLNEKLSQRAQRKKKSTLIEYREHQQKLSDPLKSVNF